MRSLAVLVPLLVALVALTTTAATAAPPRAAKWTVMVYMSGDNNLEDYIVNDLELELGALGSNADVEVVALADRGPGYDTRRGDWQSTKLFHVTQGMQADAASAVADWGERNMGNPQTLVDFVTWTKANYPADRYALVFWGHGWSWHPGWVMEDDTSADTLDYHELEAALPSLGFNDVVAWDGCNMASLEILKQWQGHAGVLSGSQEYVGWDGIEYDTVIAQLRANPTMTTDQAGVAFGASATNDRTWSTIALDGRLTTLVTAVDQWSTLLRTSIAANRRAMTTAFSATQSFWQAPMDKDLYDMAYEIKRNVPVPALQTASQNVMNAVDGAVLFERHVNSYADAHGITIYHPSKSSQRLDHAYYKSTVELALTTGWDEFLDAWAP
ncbi:MAG: clostripain-related cysteine peptidase [Gaiella sp.]